MSNHAIVPSKRIKRLREREIASGTATSGSNSLFCNSWVFRNGWVFFLATLLCSPACGDWPQINGPNRDGVAVSETLLTRWPQSGLTEAWSHVVGQGNAGPVVVGDKLIVFHRPGDKYLVEALNCRTGIPIWKTELEADYQGGMDGDGGPKCVPLVHQDRVFLYGAGGVMFCLDLADGTRRWTRNLRQQLRGRDGFFGVGTTPIMADGKLIVNAGGRDASIVAMDPTSGDIIWKTFSDDASYSSPIEITIDGKTVVIFVTRLNLVGVDPANGDVVFKTRFGKSGPTVNAAMPVSTIENGQAYVFVTAAYGVGARWLKFDKAELETVWENDTSFSSQYSTPVISNRLLFGTAGREDFKDGSFRCVDVSNGQVLWNRDQFPVGHSLLVGEQILVLDSEGGFHVIQANRDEFKEVYQSKIFQTPARAMPALSNGFFYARSNADRKGLGKLVCFEVGQHK